MFARGVAYLHTAQLPVPKSLAAKSCICPTSKLIQNKQLQLLHFGHLRKTGGRGSYRLVHAAHLPFHKGLTAESSYPRTGHPMKDVHPEPAEGFFSASSVPLPSPILPTLAHPSRKSNLSRTYRVPGGGGNTGFLVRPIHLVSKSLVSPAYARLARKFLVSPTYAKTGGHPPCGKCRRADIL